MLALGERPSSGATTSLNRPQVTEALNGGALPTEAQPVFHAAAPVDTNTVMILGGYRTSDYGLVFANQDVSESTLPSAYLVTVALEANNQYQTSLPASGR